MAVSGINSLSGIGTALNDRKTIAGNFDTFLQLLISQLKNQNPLDPLDTHQFTQQLVQFSSVEQSIKTNENLENLLRLSLASTSTALVGYIGKTVTVDTPVAQLREGKAEWNYQASGPIAGMTVTIRDASGNIVFSEERTTSASKGTFEWDGRRSDGSQAPDGAYTISIVGRDAAGQTVGVGTTVTSVVDGIDMSGAEPMLIIGDIRITLDAITSVGQK